MLFDQDTVYVKLPDGVYPENFTEKIMGKYGVNRVFSVIGRKGLLEQPLSPEVMLDQINKISKYVSEEYHPTREALHRDVEVLLIDKNYPEALAHARFNGQSEELSDKCKIAMDDLFFCFKRNNGGLLKETKNALLALIDEAALYSLKSVYQSNRLDDDEFREKMWSAVAKKYHGEQIWGEDLKGITPYELASVDQELFEKNTRRLRLNERRMDYGLPLLKPLEELITEKMLSPDDRLDYDEHKNQVITPEVRPSYEIAKEIRKMTNKYLELSDPDNVLA